MLRFKCIAVIFVFLLILPLTVKSSFGEELSVGETWVLTEEFIAGLIDKVVEEGTTKEHRDDLLKTALNFAKSYSELKDDRGAFHRAIKKRIDSLPPSLPSASAQEEADPTSFEDPVLGRLHAEKTRAMVEEFITRLIRRALDEDVSGADRQELLGAVVFFAKSYGEMKNDLAFYQSIKHIVEIAPDVPEWTDERIIFEFNEAMGHDNTFVMEYLVVKLGGRLETFVMDIIEEAMGPGLSEWRRNDLFKTAMNIAKTDAAMTGDNSFHRSIHTKIFTARLDEPTRSELVGGLHIIDTPPATRLEKNKFIPDNIIIGVGETVRWTNRDTIIHVMGTIDFLSDGHFFAPSIGPDLSFEYTFKTPGTYYYICYIHNSMIGKITVEE